MFLVVVACGYLALDEEVVAQPVPSKEGVAVG
jgi:hypothetical protein